MTKDSFRFTAAWCAIISMFLAFGTVFLSAFVLNFDANLFNAAVSNNAAVILSLFTENPALTWWPSVFDFLGFYLLLLPLTLYLHHLLKQDAPEWMNLFTVCGLGYLFFGAMGAATLAVVFSSQAAAYAATTGSAQQMHAAIFEAFGIAIQRGVWGILDPVLAGIWWTGLGLLLRKYRLILGWYTLVLGLVNLFGGFFAVLGLETIAGFCLNLYFLMAPIWACWMGIMLLRHDEQALRSLPVPTD